MFVVPASTKATSRTTFEFEIEGAKFEVDRAKYVAIEDLIGIEYDNIASLDFLSGSSEEQRAAVRSLDREQYAALMEAWRKDSEVTSGESGASSS